MHLVLDTPGTALLKEQEQFCVKYTHGKQLVHPEKVRLISLSQGIQASTDAILLAIQHEIEILFVNRGGDPRGRVWSNRFGSISTIRKNQVYFITTSKATGFILDLLREKLNNQVALLLSLKEEAKNQQHDLEKSMGKLLNAHDSLAQYEGELIRDCANSLRGIEGSASRLYWQSIGQLLPEAYRFSERSRRPAKDMFNALLNYAYGMLYGILEGAVIRAGIDPYLGILHRDEYNRPVLVYDLIEKYRAWPDYVVTGLCMQRVIQPEFFDIVKENDYWLNSEGKRILIQSVNDYLDEHMVIEGKERSRRTHMDLFCQDFAGMLKRFVQIG